MSASIEHDWKLIGYVITGCVGCIIITFVLGDLLRNFVNNRDADHSQKYLSILSVANALLLCFMVAFVKTNVFIRHLDHEANGLECKITSAVSGVFYILSKFSMYILFTYRIEIVFSNSVYAVSHRFLCTMRYVIVILAIFFCIVTNFPEKEQVTTPTYNITSCTMKKGEFHRFGSIMVVIFVLTDLLLLLWLLWLFNSKLYKMSKLLTGGIGLEQDEATISFLTKINKHLIKSTILVSTSIISTLFFVFVGVFIWKPIGWFMPLDMTVHALSIYFMYTFSGHCYTVCCCVCIKCCSLCIGGVDKDIFWNISVPKLTIGNYSETKTKATQTKSSTAEMDLLKVDVSAKNMPRHVIADSTSLEFEQEINEHELEIQKMIPRAPANSLGL